MHSNVSYLKDLDSESVVSGDEATGSNSTLTTKDGERTTLARKENTAVKYMGGAVFVVLLATAVCVSSAVYSVTRNDQISDFQNAFEADANKILQTFNRAVERRLESIDALSVSITAYAEDSGSTFPNVTVSNFETRCANSRILSDTAIIQYHPIVSEEDRAGWEEYQVSHQDHFDKAFASEVAKIQYQDEELGQHGDRMLQAQPPVEIMKEISLPAPNGTFVAAPLGSGPYLPLWQFSPMTPSKVLLNLNILYTPVVRDAYLETMKTGQAVIGTASNLNSENTGDSGALWKMVLSMSQFRKDIAEYESDPVSVVGYPVFDSFDLVNRKVVAILGTNFYWQQYFKNVLPRNTKGIICVLENSQNQTFTYRIDDVVTYMGDGDHHEAKYNDMMKTSNVASYMASISSPETRAYTSVTLNADHCSYTLRVYPSQDNEDIYVTNVPIVLTSTILAVFLFTSVVFILYTKAVGRRQEVVMNRAVASSAIVSSLFPSQVRDQIYQENDNGANVGAKQNMWKRESQTETTGMESAPNGRPIAQLFDNTTIMFADMVGFTEWSSKRTPVQVFELLETIYKAFDTIAIRRKVFKVETIGDCYVAVAGLPDPQEDHAIIMAKFADDCMAKMSQLTTELAEVLGADTAGLKLRVGLHSGSVTGGVLRGEKSRFQLFGDTMNTASRMESNGAPGRIHASYETITELGAKGKSNWVTARDDMIVVKGKGQLQTFWVSPRAMAGSVVSAKTYGAKSEEEREEDEVNGNKRVLESVEI